MILAIQRQPGTNTVDVVDSIRALLPEFRRAIPPADASERGVRRLANPSAPRFTTWSSP